MGEGITAGEDMVEYNLVKICGLCRTRFTVPKKEFKRYYCKPCEKRVKRN